MIHVCKLCKRILNVRNQQQWREKNKRVLWKFHFSLTFFKDLNFPRLKLKFPDFSLTLQYFLFPDHFLSCCDNHAHGGSTPSPGVIQTKKTTLLQNDRQQS